MADGPAANEWFRHLAHRNGRLDPGLPSSALEGILEGNSIDHRSQHAHVVCRAALHAVRGGGHSPEDIAAADDHGNLDAEEIQLPDLFGNSGGYLGADAIGRIAHE